MVSVPNKRNETPGNSKVVLFTCLSWLANISHWYDYIQESAEFNGFIVKMGLLKFCCVQSWDLASCWWSVNTTVDLLYIPQRLRFTHVQYRQLDMWVGSWSWAE